MIIFGQFINTTIDYGQSEGATDMIILNDTVYINGFKSYINKSSKISVKYSLSDGNYLVDEFDASSGTEYFGGVGNGMNIDFSNDRIYYTGSKQGVGYLDKAYILITNVSGDSLKEISFQDSTRFQSSMLLTDNEHLICVGSSNNHNPNSTDINMYIVKCDTAGNIIWENDFGSGGGEMAYSVDQTHDGGFVMAGYTNSYGAGSYDIYVVKVDSLGNFEWQKTFGDVESEAGKVKALSNGDILIHGAISDPVFNESQATLIKVDSLGNQKWLEKYGYNHDKDDWFQSMVVVDNGYIFCGASVDETDNNPLGFILKTDFNGNELWRRRYRKRDSDNYFRDITELPNGDLVLCGFVFSEGVYTQDAWLVRTNCAGFDTLPSASAALNSNSSVTMEVSLDNNSKNWRNCIINWGDGNSSYLYEDYDTLVTHQYETANTWDIEVIAMACDSTDTTSLQVTTNLNGVGLEENKKDNSFSLYPNPTSQNVNLVFQQRINEAVVQINDLSGRQVFNKNIQQTKKMSINTDEWSGGVYLITLTSPKGILEQRKLVVRR